MIPITWNVNDKSTHLNVDSNGLGVNYTGSGEIHEDAAIRTNVPISFRRKLFYFEVEIINNETNGIISIGLCTKSAELNKLPGCGKNSCGYHSDDGNFFDCSEIEEPYGPTFKTGDTIGCCLDFRNHTVFYTKNGINLGMAFRDLKDLENDLYYPCIGIRPRNGSIFIEANFGHKEFKYAAITENDIDDDQLKEKWIKVLKQCDNDDKDTMIEDIIKSLKTHQNNTFALRYSAKTYFIMGKYDKALKLLTELLENEPDVKISRRNLFYIE
ncbi:concanavalin A-like lectin/glucanase domain-containing protein [Gigaspora rosea]|uniref:Concanavalin A-like lectin/glucanase domain-containing protein n=1 Tax=Gigaspora rosea TaxID=44941 RepID=A0A397VZ64_9GLOM|nr:concanavalin A-like lectin/glucanase domain-containing protein [Gigaspora rosea]